MDLMNSTAATFSTSSEPTTTTANCTDPNDRLNLQCIDDKLKGGASSLVQLFLVTSLSGLWIIYITYYNSRFQGLIISKILNQFHKDAYIHIGSFSFSVLSGKLMFRDVNYITKDLSVHIYDGYCIFRWWRPYKFSRWRKQKDLSHGHTRLSIVISGLEYHLYNRTEEYNRLQELFGQNKQTTEQVSRSTTDGKNEEIAWWRSLFPVIKFSISYGRLIFGNRLLPNTLVLSFTDGELQYKSTEPTTPSDLFLHVLEGSLGSIRLKLLPSLGYDPSATPAMLGILDCHNDPPPRKMGKGYVVLHSHKVDIHYVWDELGLVKAEDLQPNVEPLSGQEYPFVEDQLADWANRADGPIWKMVLRFGKRTTLNFSPWADRQRELLWKFFFPADYQDLKVTQAPIAGDRRVAKSFKLSAIMMKGADFDILFTKNEEIHAIQINTAEGSCIEVDVPMVIGESGYTSYVSGQLLNIEVSTSMQYRTLLKSETFGFDVKSHYPLRWNDLQTWHCDITASKTSVSLVLSHKDFIADLMSDWATKSPPDLLFFIPYTFDFNVKLDEFELFLPVNMYNWIDCDLKPKDNAYLGLVGTQLCVGFSLPFEKFLPPTFTIPFKFQLHQGQLCIFLPESNKTRSTLLNLARQQRKWDEKTGSRTHSVNWLRNESKTWGFVDADWVPCWEVLGMDLTLTYTWHPVVVSVPIKKLPKLPPSISKRKSEEKRQPSLLEQASSLKEQKFESSKARSKTTVTFDPSSLEADEIRVDLELTPGSTLVLYGTLLDLILIFKDNYLGYDDVYTDFNSKRHGKEERKPSVVQPVDFNTLEFRPLQVTVNINLNDINGILPTHPTSTYIAQPSVKLKHLHFEMDKNILQTRLQLLLSGLEVSAEDSPTAARRTRGRNEIGRLKLSDLQFRGHAMFSGAGLPLGATLIEYAWLTEVLIGAIKAEFSVTQIGALVEWAEVFVFLLSNEANHLKKAFPHRTLPTGIAWDETKNDGSSIEETDVKYLMIKVRLDAVHLRLVQNNSFLDLLVSPVTISNGNVQDRGILEAVSVVADQVQLKHRISKPKSDEWMDTGDVRFGPIITQVAIATQDEMMVELQEEFLRFHDRKTRRLDFLYEQDCVDGPRPSSTGMASLLDSVRVLKSWGCSFFSPVSSKHSTFYYEDGSQTSRARILTSPAPDEGTFSHDVPDGHGHASVDQDIEEVFDSRMDYGMSLLREGKCLLTRPESPEKIIVEKQEEPSLLPPPPKPLPAGLVLMAANLSSEETNAQVKSTLVPLEKQKSVSCEDLPQNNPTARVVSTDSHIYRSADFKGNSSVSSDDYYSAESDVERLGTNSPTRASDSILKKTKSEPCSSYSLNPDQSSSPEIPTTRPEHLEIEFEETEYHTEIDKPGVVRKLELNDHDNLELLSERSDFPPSVLSKKSPIKDQELLSCYSYVLATSKLHNSDWMSEFDEVQHGIHPSVIIDKEGSSHKMQKRASMDILDEDRSENCSRIVLHVRGGIDIQLSPFLVDSVQQAVDSMTAIVTKEHPITVLNRVQMKCTSEAATDYHLSKLDQNEGDATPQDNESNKPGTRVEIYMDSLRVNLIQATVGDDTVFNLKLNKMMPTPCIMVMSIRLDKLDVKSQLNSKRDKLLKKARMKKRSSTDGGNMMDSLETLNNASATESMAEPLFVLFLCHASVSSLACQMRVLSHDGCAPERSNVTALPDDACRAPFKLNSKILLPSVKKSVEKYADFQKRPPKPWGWVMMEAGLNKISADLTKYDLQGASNVSKKQHASEGKLNVDLLWFNLASPPSSSQITRSSRNFRSWNLLTSIAPSCSAWLAPCDRLIGAIDRYTLAVTKRCLNCMGAVVTMTLKEAEENDRSLLQPSQHKYEPFTDLSKAIQSDSNCVLCDTLQRYLLNKDHVDTLESAVSEDRSIPTMTTLETGIQVVVGRWLNAITSTAAKGDKQGKKRTLSRSEGDPTLPELRNPSVNYGGDLDIAQFITAEEDRDRPRRQSAIDGRVTTDEHVTLISEPERVPNPAEELVYEQQRDMYSWMQNQTQNDVEAQTHRPSQAEKEQKFAQKEVSDALMHQAKKIYANFLNNTGVMRSSESGENFLQSHCSGSLAVKATLDTIRVEKQDPDRVYSRDSTRKRKKETASIRRQRFTNQRSSSIETPIVLCRDLSFEVSARDTLIEDDGNKQTNQDTKNQSMNNIRMKANVLKFLKTRSKLSVDVGMSLAFVQQRIDIALVRLCHQFVQCSDSIQQAKTDIQVNKYTAGASSPDPAVLHRRLTSNVSTVTASSAYADQFFPPPPLRRRHTSPSATQRDLGLDNDSIASSSSEDSLEAPQCWQDLYKLVDQHSSDTLGSYQENVKFETELKRGFSSLTHSTLLSQPFVCMEIKLSLMLSKLQLLAEIGDLKVSTNLCDLNADASHVRISLNLFRYDAKSSIRVQLDKITADVIESSKEKKTIVASRVGLCRLNAFTDHHREKEGGNTCELFIGLIVIDLPLHPASLHDVVSRGTKQLTTHIQEFAQTPSYKQSFDIVDGTYPPVTPSASTLPPITPITPSAITALIDLSQDSSDVHTLPVVVSLVLEAEGLEMGASLLPSLTVKYTAGKMTGNALSGKDASFNISMPKHALHFASAVSSLNEFGPVSTDIELPPIKGEGELKQHKAHDAIDENELQMKEGEYLSVSVLVGSFEHTLTTDLLNHLIFLQEVFMQEVNDVIQKMSNNETPFPVWSDSSIKSVSSSQDKPMLYQLQLQLDGIQITASTPSNNAVRLKTGTMTFELSNRVIRGGNKLKNIPKYLKLFGKAQVELNLALGTLVDNNVYPEVEPEFHQMAYFTTRIGLQNTTQQSHTAHGMQGLEAPGKQTEDNSVILISLLRPIFYFQPTAFDKAILIFLAYKNAYDEWSERRAALENDQRFSTKQVVNVLQSKRSAMSNAAQSSMSTSNLFLQLSVHDLGICLPVSHHISSSELLTQDELSSALVLTIDNTLISACYARSLVTTGQFRGFCLRFSDDFQTYWDDWSPKGKPTNSFVVPDGTYQICTDTTSYQRPSNMTARTTVNVVWQMKGMDVQLDTKIGFYLTNLVKTMTVITGRGIGRDSMSSDKFNAESESESFGDLDVTPGDVPDALLKPSPSDVRSSSSNKELSLKEKSKKIEQEYNEQTRLVNDLRSLGAKPSTIEEQERRLQDLETSLSSVFRQAFKNKLRRTSVKNSSLKLDPPQKRPTHQRSVSSGIGLSPFAPVKPTQSAYSTLPPSLSQKRRKSDWTAFSDVTDAAGSSNTGDYLFGNVIESSEESSIDNDSDVADDGIPVFPNTKSEDSSFEQNQFSQLALQSEADLELVLDIRVGIDGGQIVCQPLKEEQDRERNQSSSSNSNQRMFPSKKPFEPNDTNTTFYVPGVEVKIRYNSEVGSQGKPQEFFTPPGSPKLAPKPPLIQVNTPGGTNALKNRSCVYVWFSIESLPETVISPCFLDFLDQTLTNIPVSKSHSSQEFSHPDDQGAVEALDSTIASLPDAVVFISVQPSQVLFNCKPVSRVECLLHIPSLDLIFSSIRNSSDTAATFHFPGKKMSSDSSGDSLASAFPTGLGFTAVMSDFSVYVFHPYGAQQPSGVEQRGGSGRKDSLSVDLEVVKINIVRTKKGAVNMETSLRLKDKAAIVNISALIDIGKASFKYDMRRLSEILAFPRAWYRRSIARRLFFGDVPEERANASDKNLPSSPLSPKRSASQSKSDTENEEQWLSVILYGLKMSRLDVQMNMSNVMGNTLWSCDGLRSQGKLRLQSSGDKDIFLSCGLDNSQLSAKGGIIGGHIELRQLYANCHLLEPVNSEPRHKVCVKMRSLDGRIEYMSGCIMMGKVTVIYLKLTDEWKGPKLSTPASSEKSSVFVPGDVSWEDFSLSISRSTTPDVIKMLAKLEEFFTQQFQNSVRALSSWRQGRAESTLTRQSSVTSNQEVYSFHRHWPTVYQAIRSLGISPHFLLGGSLCLHGNQLTIVCFHGNNFRSRQWVLFHILEPNIMFSTEVQEIKESMTGYEASTLATQSLTFNLGHDYLLKTANDSSDPMTTVSRVTRSGHANPPPSSASVDEWFAYVTASRSQELSMLRTLNEVGGQESGFAWSPAGSVTRNASTSNYSHETDIIFALPKLQLLVRTEHMQGPYEPDPNASDKPVVECSFVAEFTDHICVTMDFELILCVHDLISSYLKEKQQALSSRNRLSSVGVDSHSTVVDPIDIRQFECKTWQLEPQVRLISWAGRRIEPVGVDFILQKLGFRHARTTIPKWFQRGVLDVLDQTLAVIVQNLVVAMMHRKKK